MIASFEWGPAGARSLAPHATVVAVVDVLSFTTALTVAVERGIAVRPYPWRDESAVRFAREHDATLAVGRKERGPVSLSPVTIRAAQGVERLVLPSPNGSAISAALSEASASEATPATVIGVSLRNAPAAAAWVAAQAPESIAVIASGERWPDGSLRPAVEDLWGAGAFLSLLERLLPPSSTTSGAGIAPASDAGFVPTPEAGFVPTPEAGAAAAAFERVAGELGAAVRDCFGGRELVAYGFPEDVEIAAELGVSAAVPVLRDGWYTAAPGARGGLLDG